jgi:hypothetical protein
MRITATEMKFMRTTKYTWMGYKKYDISEGLKQNLFSSEYAHLEQNILCQVLV